MMGWWRSCRRKGISIIDFNQCIMHMLSKAAHLQRWAVVLQMRSTRRGAVRVLEVQDGRHGTAGEHLLVPPSCVT
jgi:hypothetical protein